MPEVDGKIRQIAGRGRWRLSLKCAKTSKSTWNAEVAGRVKARNKEAVMDALVKTATLDVPQALIAQDTERLAEE